jgi:hypothetical protein
MRTYAMPLREVLALSLRTFWHLSGTVPRLMADEQKQLLEIHQTAMNPQGSIELHNALDVIAPEPVKMSVQHKIAQTSVRDVEGFASLKAMAG